ncbi:MAG: anti-sigma B factor antagonist [Cyclobacteriaceae bacterium]|jgi:anti-sigma B factor antagonist
MTYEHSIVEGYLKVTFIGDLIGESKGMELVELANDHIHKGVIYALIDISDVRYINSSGIGVLITLLTKFRNKNGDLFLIRPSDHVKKLLIITKLQSIFNLVDTSEEAMEIISKK